MSDSITALLIFALAGVIIIYLLLYVPLTRKVAWKTVEIPVKTMNHMRKSRKKKREMAYVYDFNHTGQRAERIRVRQGAKNWVLPRANADDELTFHTHQQVTDPIDNVLRERPSGSDLVQLMKSPRTLDGVITPTGRIIIYEKTEQSDLNKIKQLDKKEYQIQKDVFTKKGFSPQTAREVNQRFLTEVKKAGINIRIVPPNKPLRVKTEVRE